MEEGFQEAQQTITGWFDKLQKRFDGPPEDDEIPPRRSSSQRQDFGASQSSQLHGIRRSAETSRRSGEHGRGYDADPQLLSDDFGHRLELRDDEGMNGHLLDWY
jgi:hypothetical protein